MTWWLTRPAPPPPAPTFTRLTSDSGLTTDPAFSPDGKLVAYASDRAGGGNLDIWRQQLATGEAVRLTSDPADESEPTFSPDGSRIAFRSERDGGGIYIVSAFGGEPRLIAQHGRRPRFSPDGTQIAYWVGTVWYVGQGLHRPRHRRTPVAVQPDFASAHYPIWSADGTKLLFLGARDPKDIPVDALRLVDRPDEWRRSGQDGGFDDLSAKGSGTGRGRCIADRARRLDWRSTCSFPAHPTRRTNLWRISVSRRNGKAEGSAQQLTSGTSVEAKPSVISGGRIAFASLTHALNIWSLPIDSQRRQRDGRAAASDELRVRRAHQHFRRRQEAGLHLDTFGKPRCLDERSRVGQGNRADCDSGARGASRRSRADGTRVFYMVSEGPKWAMYQIATTGGVPGKHL